MNVNIQQRWHQEPWVWFNLGLLGAAVTAAIVMTMIAIAHTPAELDSHWYQDGVLAKQQKKQMTLIKQIHLQGNLLVRPDQSVHLTLTSDKNHLTAENIKNIQPDKLILYIEHSSNPALDQNIELIRQGENQYSGRMSQAVYGKHNMLISPTNDAWYLTGSGYFPMSGQTIFEAN